MSHHASQPLLYPSPGRTGRQRNADFGTRWVPPETDRQGTIRKPFVVACTLTRKGSHASTHPCCNPRALVKQHSTINIYPRGQVSHGAGSQTGQMDLSRFVHIGGEVHFLFVGACPVPLIKVPGDKMQVSSGFCNRHE